MNKLQCIFLVISLVLSVARGQEVRMDFSRSHTLNDIVGLELMRLFQTSKNGDKSYFSTNPEILISLPSGQKIVTKTQSLEVRAKADGTLIYVRILGPIMPLDEVYEAGKKLYSAFSIPHDRLEDWKLKADSEGSSARTVSNGQGKYYPHIFIEILHSMNKLYPWTISMSLGWIDENPEKHSEAWGHENNPKPPLGLEIVSLEPPSGKTYDRADAWVEANRRQDELDKKLGQVRGSDGQLISGLQDLPQERPEKQLENPSENKGEKQTNGSSTLFQRMWWLALLPPALILTWFLSRRSSK